MNNTLKFLILAATCALVILLITIGIKTANKGKDDIEGNVNEYSTTSGDYNNVDLELYDGTIVRGAEIKRLIESYNDDDYLSVVVKTKRGESRAYINSCKINGLTVTTNSGIDYSALPKLKSDSNYISATGEFLSTVYYDTNDVVACIWFQQQ